MVKPGQASNGGLTSWFTIVRNRFFPRWSKKRKNVPMTASVNQAIFDYLDYYIDSARKLDYAVMLEGPWGAGKTHLVRSFLATHETRGGKHLFISLYGMTSTSQIDEEFYRLLHPVLSSKGMRLAGVLARGVAKGVLKIDFSEKNASENLTLGVPDVDLKEYLKGPTEQLLVFDDFERCLIPISEVLGYINAFVEREGMKVIILGNGLELEKLDKRFLEIKEKLIGQTLRVQSDVVAAYPAFLKSIYSARANIFLETHQDQVLAMHAESKTNNLRILKQSMWDFERISLHISEEDWKKSDAIQEFMRLSLAMSMEIRAGWIKGEDLSKLNVKAFSRYMRKQNNEPDGIAEKFEKKYLNISISNPVFNPEVLGKIIIEGLNDGKLMKDTLQESRFFAKDSSIPAWIRAWDSFENDDDIYESALKEVLQIFESRAEREPGIIYHIFGILLRASDIGAIEKTRAEVFVAGKAYVDDLKKAGRLYTSLERQSTLNSLHGFGGFGFTESKTKEFLDFVNYYTASADTAAVASYSTIARSLLDKLDHEPQEFLFDLCVNSVRASPYYEEPVLTGVSAQEFVDKVMSLPAKQQSTIFSMFKLRYEFDRLNQSLALEKDWLENVRALFLQSAAKARPITKVRTHVSVKSVLDPLLEPEPPTEQAC
jgi:hypothetical protein